VSIHLHVQEDFRNVLGQKIPRSSFSLLFQELSLHN